MFRRSLVLALSTLCAPSLCAGRVGARVVQGADAEASVLELPVIRVGEFLTFDLGVDQAVAHRFTVEHVERLRVWGTSHRIDLDLTLAGSDGATLVEVTGPNPAVAWTPPAPGEYVVTLHNRSPWAAAVSLETTRGDAVLDPRDDEEAELAYWALYTRLAHLDGSAERLAHGGDGLGRILGCTKEEAIETARLWHETTLRWEAELDTLRALEPSEHREAWRRLDAWFDEVLAQEQEPSGIAIPGYAHIALAAEEWGYWSKSLAAWTRHRELLLESKPRDASSVLQALGNVAVARAALADLPAARHLYELVVDGLRATQPPGSAELWFWEANLAAHLERMGDFLGSLVLVERIVRDAERSLELHDPDLARYRANLGWTLRYLNRDAEALACFEQALAAKEAVGESPAQLLALRAAVTEMRGGEGKAERLVELREQAVQESENRYPPEHPNVWSERVRLASALYRAGRREESIELWRSCHEAGRRMLPVAHPERRNWHANLLWAEQRAARPRDVPRLLSDFLEDEVAAVRMQATRSNREARSVSSVLDQESSVALSMHRLSEPSADRDGEVFAWIETRRSVLASRSRGQSSSPRAAALRRDLFRVRAQAAGLVEGAALDPRRLEAVVRDAERLERELIALDGPDAGAMRAADVARALPPEATAISFLRWRCLDPAGGPSHHRFLSLLVTPDGRCRSLDLGPAEEIEAAVAAWRRCAGVALGKERARSVPGSAAERDAAGSALFRLVLAPALESCPETRTLFVCLDDALHLVPLDALPLEDGLVGDEVRIRVLPSFRALTDPGAGSKETELGLLVAGNLDYDGLPAGGGAPAGRPGLSAATLRGGDEFGALECTLGEVERVVDLHRRSFDGPIRVLQGSSGTKAAFQRLAPGARFLHIASHGYFDEPPWAEPQAQGGGAAGITAAYATSLLPMSMSGLALAGANRGRAADGSVPGILTADELALLDLSGCELAVLSACETNVGIRGAGSGIQSLQAALHTAGVRSAIASLWKVDCSSTERLFGLLYAEMWERGLTADEALWSAKMQLRAQRVALRDWAGWVFSEGSSGRE